MSLPLLHVVTAAFSRRFTSANIFCTLQPTCFSVLGLPDFMTFLGLILFGYAIGLTDRGSSPPYAGRGSRQRLRRGSPPLAGMLAGLYNQPAVLGYAVQQAKNDLPDLGYATTFPMATIAKIILAQLLLLLL